MSSSGYRRMEAAKGETRLAWWDRRDRVRCAIGVSLVGGIGILVAGGAGGAVGALDRVRLAMGACGSGVVGCACGTTLGAARWGRITCGASCFDNPRLSICWGEFVTVLAGVSTLGDGLSGCGTDGGCTISTGAGVTGIGTVVGTSGCCGL